MKDVFKKSVYGIGFIGSGIHKTTIKNKATKAYVTWKNMMYRCYNPKRLETFPSYEDCIVCDDWHNFQIFAEWYSENYVEGFHLDKDLLFKKNNLYSKETCVFIPQEINKLLTKTNLKRGEYPIGVYYYKKENKFKAQLCLGLKVRKFLGHFNNVNEAFAEYKKHKEFFVKQTAEKYKHVINKEAYLALINYQVEITD